MEPFEWSKLDSQKYINSCFTLRLYWQSFDSRYYFFKNEHKFIRFSFVIVFNRNVQHTIIDIYSKVDLFVMFGGDESEKKISYSTPSTHIQCEIYLPNILTMLNEFINHWQHNAIKKWNYYYFFLLFYTIGREEKNNMKHSVFFFSFCLFIHSVRIEVRYCNRDGEKMKHSKIAAVRVLNW